MTLGTGGYFCSVMRLDLCNCDHSSDIAYLFAGCQRYLWAVAEGRNAAGAKVGCCLASDGSSGNQDPGAKMY